MHKAILMSVIIAALVLPWRASRERDPRRGTARLALTLCLFIGAWALAVKFVVMRIIVVPTLDP
jgi:hypothetical protein